MNKKECKGCICQKCITNNVTECMPCMLCFSGSSKRKKEDCNLFKTEEYVNYPILAKCACCDKDIFSDKPLKSPDGFAMCSQKCLTKWGS